MLVSTFASSETSTLAARHPEFERLYKNASDLEVHEDGPRMTFVTDHSQNFHALLVDTSFLQGHELALTDPEFEDTRAELGTRYSYKLQNFAKLKKSRAMNGSVWSARTVITDNGTTYVLNEEHRFDKKGKSYASYFLTTMRNEAKGLAARNRIAAKFAEANSRKLIDRLEAMNGLLAVAVPEAKAENRARNAPASTTEVRRASPAAQKRINPNGPDPRCLDYGIENVDDIRRAGERDVRYTNAQLAEACPGGVSSLIESTGQSLMPGDDIPWWRGVSQETREDLGLLFPPLFLANAGYRAMVGVSRSANEFANWVIANKSDLWTATTAKISNEWNGFWCLSAHKKIEIGCQVLAAMATGAVGRAVLSRTALAQKFKKTIAEKTAPIRARARAVGGRITAPIVALVRRGDRSDGDTTPAPEIVVTAPRRDPWKIRETIENFRARLIDYDPTTDAQRLDMMTAVFSKLARGAQVLDIENAFLKHLNDNDVFRIKGGPWTKDKDLVTALTNQHKQIVDARMKAFAEKYKDVLDLKSYSDFKSQRFALIPKSASMRVTGLPDSIFKELDDLYRQANKDFAAKVKEMGVESKLDPETWFRAGMDPNADEANLNARFARDLDTHSGGIVRSNTPGMSDAKVRAFNELNQALDSLGIPYNSAYMEVFDRVILPRPEVFDIVKKANGDVESLKAALRATYPSMKVDDTVARNLINYANRTDKFQAGIWQSSRQVASVAEAKFGGITIDVKGMGSNNAFETALEAARFRVAGFVSQSARAGERYVTRTFREKMNAISEVALSNCRKYGLECFVRISGDDVVVVPTNGSLPRNFARDNLRGINERIGAGQVRQAEIGPGVANGPNRVTIGQHGESIEKIVRGNLERGPLAARARGLTFSVRMRTEIPDIGGIQIQISGPGANSLSAAERATLIQTYRRSIDEFNAKAPGDRQYSLSR